MSLKSKILCCNLWLLLIKSSNSQETELPKLWKCCPDEQFFNIITTRCEKSPNLNLDDFEIDPGIYDYKDSPDYNQDDDFQDLEPAAKSQRSRGSLDEDEEEETVTESLPLQKFIFLGTKFPNCGSGYELSHPYNVGNDPTSGGFTILPDNGSLFLTLADDSLIYKDFCVDRGFKAKTLTTSKKAAAYGFGKTVSIGPSHEFQGTVVAFCKPVEETDCLRRPCVQSCCGYDEVYNAQTLRCDEPRSNSTEVVWTPELRNSHSDAPMTQNDLINYWKIQEPKLGSKFPIRIFYSRSKSCRAQTYDTTNNKRDFKIYQNGDLDAGGGIYNYTSYCVRRVESVEQDSEPVFWTQAKVCISDNPELQGYIKWITIVDLTLIPALLVISVIFLCLLFIYLWMKNRAKLFGSMMLSTIATLGSFYIFLTAVKFAGSRLVRSSPVSCTVLGFLIQFTNLSSFFWLNAMSFDIWMKFRSLTTSESSRRMSTFQRENKYGCAIPRFKWYALYAWGLPIIVVIITIIIQEVQPDSTEHVVLPLVGQHACFLGPKLSTLLYLHVITAPVLCTNIIFFFAFVYNLCCGVWASSPTDPIAQQRQRSNLKTVVKMFFVMGLTWIAEIISFVVSWAFGGTKVYKYVIFFDLINALQGVTMFCVLFFDRENIKKIRKFMNSRNSTQKTSNSSATPSIGERVPRFSLLSLTPIKIRRPNRVNPAQETCDVKL